MSALETPSTTLETKPLSNSIPSITSATTTNEKIIITNRDLYKKNDYAVEDLIENIDNLFPSTIIKTQKKLTDDFIEKYILSEDYAKIREDYDITLNDLINYYPNYGFT